MARFGKIGCWPQQRYVRIMVLGRESAAVALLAMATPLIGAAHPNPQPAATSASSASASSSDAPAVARALELFQLSELAYREGQFQQAIQLLQRAHSIHPEPVLLFNLSRAYQGLGDIEGELDALTRYVGADPKAPDRKAIEERIQVLKHLVHNRARPTTASSSQNDSDAAPQPRNMVVPWAMTGVGIAALGTGTILGLLSHSRHQSAVEQPVQVKAQAQQDQAQSFATASTIAFVTGGVLTAAGITWIVWNSTAPSPVASPVAASLHLRVGAGSVLIGGRF